MDQQAFRSLISSSSSSSSSAAPSSSKPRVFGASQKRSAGGSSSSTSSKDLFAPRKKTPANNKDRSGPRPPPKNSATGETYVDRAKARRVGKEDEDYSDVNRLAEEWRVKWNAAQSEEERRDIEEQMAFLGGDARHSILVKGLDHSLLAQQKAKEAGGEGDVDDYLERAYDEAAAKASSPVLRRDEEESRASPSSLIGEKRSRESVIEALKRRKLAKAQAGSAAADEADDRQQQARDAEFERARKLGKFKPISAGTSSGGFKPVEADKGEVIITKDGKRLRKKKKKPAEEQGEKSVTPTRDAKSPGGKAATASESPRIKSTVRETVQAVSPLAVPSPKQPTVSPSRPSPPILAGAETASPKARAMSLSPPPLPEDRNEALPPIPGTDASTGTGVDVDDDDDDDDDIFADAGRWEGLPDDDSEDDEGVVEAQKDRPKETLAPSGSTSMPKGNWFGEEDKTSGQQAGSAPLPVGLNQLLSSVQHGATTIEGAQARAEEESEDEPAEGTGRLQGLSTSSLPSNVSRMLLQAEQEEARKAEEKEKGWWKKKKDRKRKKAEGDGAGSEAEDGETN
ncbi:hypothetical protein BCV69DRAFT_281822 [Microstroma glucosiphilum]|uniref:RED-like N-terminal domain-containing protein n=1 Tax=Pseudomicrostroma glucosiphilum TaxID=1684307 RepID=A0A316UFK5_9BASI|nr:hypothetical protein BCV69DRAFT_281822 [Pseudomicrostroma glucosiphilum]PWN21915.1 hypothetical protein BCV69DRAFT_281822 [Pseudomicrostroma glucosiphilum]